MELQLVSFEPEIYALVYTQVYAQVYAQAYAQVLPSRSHRICDTVWHRAANGGIGFQINSHNSIFENISLAVDATWYVPPTTTRPPIGIIEFVQLVAGSMRASSLCR